MLGSVGGGGGRGILKEGYEYLLEEHIMLLAFVMIGKRDYLASCFSTANTATTSQVQKAMFCCSNSFSWETCHCSYHDAVCLTVSNNQVQIFY